MSRVHRVGVIAGARQSMKTRAEFNAHVATRGASTTAATDATAGSWYFNYAADGSVGYGSIWRPGFDQGLFGGSFDKAAAHAFPDATVRTAQIGQRVFVAISSLGFSYTLISFSRNGITTDAGDVDPILQSGEFLYYDDVAGPMKMIPGAASGNGPTPYTW